MTQPATSRRRTTRPSLLARNGSPASVPSGPPVNNPEPSPRTSAAPRSSGGPRYHGLDALRGGAMFLVVTLHAALAYTRWDVPRLLWGVREPSSHPAFDGFCWWAMGVSLPLFFMIAGFFAAELTRTRGLGGFVRNRVERIALPTAAAAVTVLPMSFLAWAAGWLATGRCSLREVRRMRFHYPGIQADLYGPAHLWFLEYLLVMLLAFTAAHALRSAWAERLLGGKWFAAWLDRRLLSPWRPLWLAVPTTLILWLSRERVGLDAVLDRHNTFAIDPLRLLHHGLFFAVGVWLNRFRVGLDRFAVPGRLYLALSLPVFLVRAWLLRQDWVEPLPAFGAVPLVVTGGLFAWLMTFGLFGTALEVLDRPSRTVRFLADSSYWVYLIHLPIVGLIQADLYAQALPTWLKFVVSLGVTLLIGLASYRVCVRYTAIGRLLHGPRRRQSSLPVSSGVVTPDSGRTAA